MERVVDKETEIKLNEIARKRLLQLIEDGAIEDNYKSYIEKKGWEKADVEEEERLMLELKRKLNRMDDRISAFEFPEHGYGTYYGIIAKASWNKDGNTNIVRANQKVQKIIAAAREEASRVRDEYTEVERKRNSKVKEAEDNLERLKSELRKRIRDYLEREGDNLIATYKKIRQDRWNEYRKRETCIVRYDIETISHESRERLFEAWKKKLRFIYEAAWELNKAIAVVHFQGFEKRQWPFTLLTIPWFISFYSCTPKAGFDGWRIDEKLITGNGIFYLDLYLLRTITRLFGDDVDKIEEMVKSNPLDMKGHREAFLVPGIPWGYVLDYYADVEWLRKAAWYGLRKFQNNAAPEYPQFDTRNFYKLLETDRLGFIKNEVWRAERIKELYDAAQKKGSEKDKLLAEDMLNVYESLFAPSLEEAIHDVRTTYQMVYEYINPNDEYAPVYTHTTRANYLDWCNHYLREGYARGPVKLIIPESWVREEENSQGRIIYYVKMPERSTPYYGNGMEMEIRNPLLVKKEEGNYLIYLSGRYAEGGYVRHCPGLDEMDGAGKTGILYLHRIRLMQKKYYETRTQQPTLSINIEKKYVRIRKFKSVTKVFVTIPDGLTYQDIQLDDYKAVLREKAVKIEQLESKRLRLTLNTDFDVELMIPAEEESRLQVTATEFVEILKKSSYNWALWDD